MRSKIPQEVFAAIGGLAVIVCYVLYSLLVKKEDPGYVLWVVSLMLLMALPVVVLVCWLYIRKKGSG